MLDQPNALAQSSRIRHVAVRGDAHPIEHIGELRAEPCFANAAHRIIRRMLEHAIGVNAGLPSPDRVTDFHIGTELAGLRRAGTRAHLAAPGNALHGNLGALAAVRFRINGNARDGGIRTARTHRIV